MRVREVDTADLAGLERDLPSGPAQVHRAQLSSAQTGATTYLAVWQDQEALGTGVIRWSGPLGPRARSRYADAPEIAHLQVGESHRGRGAGSAIIAAAETMVAARGHRLTVIGVGEDNPQAQALYLRLGYERTGLVDVLGYTWVDLDGVRHPVVEQTEILVKELSPCSGGVDRGER